MSGVQQQPGYTFSEKKLSTPDESRDQSAERDQIIFFEILRCGYGGAVIIVRYGWQKIRD